MTGAHMTGARIASNNNTLQIATVTLWAQMAGAHVDTRRLLLSSVCLINNSCFCEKHITVGLLWE